MADLDRTERPTAETWAATEAADGVRARRDDVDATLERGALVGRYVVVDRLGAGGMGIVYSAYDPELDRKVALKMLRAEADGHAARARLLREAQALARLDHPNVVAVHDVGAVGERVWLAMEFVDGHTLGRWCAERPRTWREIVEVMTQAGRGLAAAHAAGLVHRDFKPDNVMVSRDGRVRVMDLGLARAGREAGASAEASELPRSRLELELTMAGAVMGTPVYMAPEQFRGEEVGPAADVFAFCVTLWEALYGERPFAGETLAELVLHVTAGELRAPPRGGRAPAWLRRIAERGLAVEAARRWPDMPSLLAAIARAQARRRFRVAGALLLVGGLAAAVGWGWRRAEESRRLAACDEVGASIGTSWNERTRTEVREALLATGVSFAAATADRVVPLLDEYAADWQRVSAGVCRERDARWAADGRLLDRAWWCLDERRLEFESLVERLTQGDREVVQDAVPVARNLKGVEECEDAATLARQPPLPASDRAELRSVRRDLARAHNAEVTGKIALAFGLVTRVLARARALQWDSLVAGALLQQSQLFHRIGRHADAEAVGEDAYFKALDAGAVGVAADAATYLIFVTGYALARPGDGRRWWRHADAAIRTLEPTPSLRTAHALVSLGNTQYVAGEYAEAEANYRRALAIEQEELGPLHLRTAATLSNLAAIPFAAGDYAAARALFEQARVVEAAAFGEEHPEIARGLNNLATIAYLTDDLPQARALYEQALAIREKVLGPDHPDVAFSLTGLADVFEVMGDRVGARAMNERALAIREKALGADHPDLAVNLVSLGKLRRAAGDLISALRLFERALAASERAYGPAHDDVATARTAIGEIYLEMGARVEARVFLERALADLERSRGPEHALLHDTLVALARLDIADLRPGEAVEFAERAVSVAEASGTSWEDLAHGRFVLATALWDAAPRERPRALALARQARDDLRAGGKPMPALEKWLASRPDLSAGDEPARVDAPGGRAPRRSP